MGKHKKTGETRTVTKTVAAESLFTCFQSFKCPDMDDQDSDEELDEEDKRLLDQSQECMTLVEDLTSTYEEAVTYYLGYGMSMAQMMGGEGGEDGEGPGFGQGGEDEDEDGEEGGEGYVPQSKFGASASFGGKKNKKK